MAIEGGSGSNEVQIQEINQSNNEQIEHNQTKHQRNGEELEGNTTIGNEGERKQINGKDEAAETTDDDTVQLDGDDNLEDEASQEQQPETDDASMEQSQLDSQDTIESDMSRAEDVPGINDEITGTLDDDNTIDIESDDEVDESEEPESREEVLDSDDSIGFGSLNDTADLDKFSENKEHLDSDDTIKSGDSYVEDNHLDSNDETSYDETENEQLEDESVGSSLETNKPEGKEPSESGNSKEIENKKSIYESENPETADKVRDIIKPYYDNAQDLAKNDPMGRAFTDHNEDHVEMVAEKSLEAGDAIKESVEKGGMGGEQKEGHIAFSSDVDKKTLEGAALSHDTGMSGDGYALTPAMSEDGKQLKDENGKKMYEKDSDGNYVIHLEDNGNFNEVRENHSLNSAINVLENRDQYKDAGYTDEQVDKMAAECMAHSKSSSGVGDLNSKEDWSDCFDRIDSTVDAYNKDHHDSPISFDRTAFESDDSKLGSLASETLALRVGDVSRDSFPGTESQSGEAVNVDRSTIDNHGGSVESELKNADITIGENGDQIDNLKSRQVHTGEQNISDNDTFTNENGGLTHEITVADGASAPKCTQEALGDHLGELASAKDENFDVDIKFNEPCDDFAKETYEKFRDEAMDSYPNVTINYPWDKEEA